MEGPLVSINIPVYNAEKYIDDCLKSVLSQTYENIEIILCDDCSTDGTWEKLLEYQGEKRITLLRNESNMQEAATRNKCIRHSKGEYIVLLDADDISEPNRVELLMAAREDGIDFIGSSCFCFDERNVIYDSIVPKEVYPTKKSLLWGTPHVDASLMIKKECLIAIHGYKVSKRLKRGADYDMVMRLYASGFRGKNIPEKLYGYRVDKNALIRRDFKSRLDECFIRYNGFKANHILLPFGWIYVFKPIPAYFYHFIKFRKMLKKND